MQTLLDDSHAYQRMSGIVNPYGDGLASRRIAAQLIANATGCVLPVRPFAATGPIEELKGSRRKAQERIARVG
jgi:hypothetical protein